MLNEVKPEGFAEGNNLFFHLIRSFALLRMTSYIELTLI